MPSPADQPNALILRGRGIGSRVGTLIGAGWLWYGLSFFPTVVRMPLGLLGLGIVVFLLNRSRRLLAISRQLPAPEATARATNRRVWKWFWLNLLIEIVLLNVAINLLVHPSQRIYWIPAISFVVGLHFLPMARFFAVSAYWLCGGAMIGAAGLTVVGLRFGGPSSAVVGAEAVANAFILWGTAGWVMHTVLPRPGDL